MAILDGISVHPFLKDRLVLKGGTALNLFFFDLPRFSVDIDLNYIGKIDRQEMLLERPEVEKALKEGRYACGAAPIGYSWDRSGTRPMIKPNENASLVKEAFKLYSTGLYSIEGVRKLVQNKGLQIQKTAFNCMLRNPIYVGNIIVPELGEEEEQVVVGVHEAIISMEIFDKVQKILTKILEKNASRVEKINYRDELPLRRLLQCPKCNASWTGSGSTGNGGKYFYYHCQNGCKERIKAEEANLAFSDYLKSFQMHPEVSNLYMAIMEDIFKTKGGV